MLPTSLRIIYALSASTFQVSSIALLSIVNTRVTIPAEYLPAYGAISFLPYSLRPVFAWLSSLILHKISDNKNAGVGGSSKDRHDKLLCPVFVLACLSFIGTTFIPTTDGIVLCFVWGFLRGVAGAWSDFCIGMTIIEYSMLQYNNRISSSSLDSSTTTTASSTTSTSYEQIVSINTAQSSTAKNIGSFIASLATFLFFYKNRNIEPKVANTLLLGTALIFLMASFTSYKYQRYVDKVIISGREDGRCYDTIDDDDDDDDIDDDGVVEEHGSINVLEGDKQPTTGHSAEEDDDEDRPAAADISPPSSSSHRQQIIEVSTLVSFQVLLAITALQKPIVAMSNQTIWISMIVFIAMILVCALCIGYKYEQQQLLNNTTTGLGEEPYNNSNPHPHRGKTDDRLSHRHLNLYFLLRYAMPISGFIMYSYLYTVFEKEPLFLQLMSVLKSAIGSISTYCYERFLSPYCHQGWSLIGLIASLDVVMGLIALLDVWVVRSVAAKMVDGEYVIDASLRWIVLIVGLVKYFWAELDYQPSLVLSTTNVYSDTGSDQRENFSSISDDEDDDRSLPLVDDFEQHQPDMVATATSPLSIDMYENENGMMIAKNLQQHQEVEKSRRSNIPVISAGMQYASFLSCIDFGAQIGDWISVPIIAAFDITRENHWDHLDKFVILCSFLRMLRIIFLWLICPKIHWPKVQSRTLT